MAERTHALPGWPASKRTRTLVILTMLLLLVGGYVAVELIALSGNVDDLLSGKERDGK